MGRSRPPYPPEFRAEAVRLVRSGAKSIRELAADLGCTEPTLRNWVAQDMVDTGEREGLTSDERARLRQLERENKLLREEREILRKAAAFFAQETMPGGSR
jgi:transposase